jgi:UrcA family protein
MATKDYEQGRSTMKRLLILALAAPMLPLASNAAATDMLGEPLGNVPSVRVHYDDLDIKQESGAAELMDRITYAARKACGPMPEATAFHLMDKWDGCVNDAFDRAVKSVDAPMLYRVAGMRNPHQHINVASTPVSKTVTAAN